MIVNRCARMVALLVITVLLLVQRSVSESRFEPLQIMCEINGYMVPAIVDTGAEISVMSTSLLYITFVFRPVMGETVWPHSCEGRSSNRTDDQQLLNLNIAHLIIEFL
jgi:hypothetical protein